ncbi:HNH endonuclease [Aureimonas leprariae]|uniref:HNH endonuclease n=1 Tax=Plantimonas leprariae TaxID=2615207 RepID=A0A7V7PME0_9HYPH|nr:HNH endonuclease [Aureimonas leprariae]KAB0678058.1 HNH endonuclease [Aureimonas leprariae]
MRTENQQKTGCPGTHSADIAACAHEIEFAFDPPPTTHTIGPSLRARTCRNVRKGQSRQKAFLVDLPDVEFLRSCLDYDPLTGRLTWKQRPASHFLSEESARAWNARFAGKPAFTCSYKGVKPRRSCITIDGVAHYLEADRVVWALHYGQPPRTLLRFRNGDRTDISIANLEAVTARDLTLAIPRVGKYATGAYRDDRRGIWWSAITISGRQKYLGAFQSEEEAGAAFQRAYAAREALIAASSNDRAA